MCCDLYSRSTILSVRVVCACLLSACVLFPLDSRADTYAYMTIHNLGCRQANHSYSGGIMPYGFEEGDLVQLILAGPNRVIDTPAANGMPGGDDQLAMNPGASFGMNMDSFTHHPNTFYSPEAILVHTTGVGPQPAIAPGVKFYVRAWNGITPSQATAYWNSDELTRDFPIGLESCGVDSAVRTFPNVIQIPYLTTYYVKLGNSHTWTPTTSVSLLAPNGNEVYQLNDPVSILWNSVGTVPQVDILLQRATGGPWEMLYDNIANDGSEIWLATLPASTQCRIRIHSSSDTTVFDIANGDFSIQGPPPPSISLVQPENGDSFVVGDPVIVQWSTLGAVELVDVLFRRNLGDPWVILFNDIENDGGEIWTSTGPASNFCRMRVQVASDTTIFSQTSSNFYLVNPAPPPTITLSDPSSGESYALGDTINFVWSSVGELGNLRLLLWRDVSPQETVRVALANDGLESWIVTAPAAASATFRLESEALPAVFSQVTGIVLSDTTYSGPPDPTVMVALSDSTHSIHLNWQRAAYATSYRVEESADNLVWSTVLSVQDTFAVVPSDTVGAPVRYFRVISQRE